MRFGANDLVALPLGLGLAVLLSLPAVTQAQRPVSSTLVRSVDAAKLYADACATCHGLSGDGLGTAARLLGSPQPRDFTVGVFKFRSTPTGSLPTDEDLYRTISRGIAGTWMPAWEQSLTPAERWALVEYIKGFSDLFEIDSPEEPITLPPEPAPTPEMLREGRFLYAMLGCAKCHGPGGRGDGPSARTLTDDSDRPIRAYDFTRGHYKNGNAPADIYRTLITGLSGTPMPAFGSEVVLLPGGADADISPARDALDAAGLADLQQYMATQPTRHELELMADIEREDIAEHRLWALVSFVQSLDRPSGVLHWLFGEDPENLIEWSER